MLSTASTALLALAALATPALAGDAGASTNKIKCKSIALGSASSYSQDALVKLGFKYASNICGKENSGVGPAVLEIAKAVATAVATTYVECESSGSGVYGHASAYAKAAATAEARAKALLQGWVEVETCQGCKAAAELFAVASTDIFVKAVAESKSQLEAYGNSSGKDAIVKAKSVVEVIASKIAAAIAEITTEVKVSVEKGEQECGVKIHGCARAGDEYGCCDLSISSNAQAIQTNALADVAVGAEALGYSCGSEYQEASAFAYAEAVAEAWAKAVSQADGWCESSQKGKACSWGETSISALAKAQAKAFASAWASANNKCNCNVNVEVTAEAFEKIFVKVHTELAVEVCVKGGAGFKFEVYVKDVKSKSVTAIATALASAVAEHESCQTLALACAQVKSNKACCSVDAVSSIQSSSTNAEAEAEALAGAYTCGDNESVEAKAEATAVAVAEAWAAAILNLEQSCESSGKASACSIVDAEITAWAKAKAYAFAKAWAGTADGCKCSVQVEAAAEKLGFVFVEVINKVWKKLCVAGNDWKLYADPIKVELTAQKAAIAQALAYVKSNNVKCIAVAGAGADVTKDPKPTKPATTTTETEIKCTECVKVNEKCGGETAESVVGCCDKDVACVRRSKYSAVCKSTKTKAGKASIARFTKEGYGTKLECAAAAY